MLKGVKKGPKNIKKRTLKILEKEEKELDNL